MTDLATVDDVAMSELPKLSKVPPINPEALAQIARAFLGFRRGFDGVEVAFRRAGESFAGPIAAMRKRSSDD